MHHDRPTDHAVLAEGLHKRYGKGPSAKPALSGFDLAVPAGSVYGLLGPNGAGKTTAVRILATLLTADGGRARVGGHDVATQPRLVRRQIGFTGQYAAVDEILSGRQNLEMFGRLFHLGPATARARARELLEQFRLTDAADRVVSGYSGGMRRRLDLAASLVLAPKVLFLDEPTTGLDPRARNEVWDAVRELAAAGTTVLLTTQYLEEADRLADRIAVISAPDGEGGRTIADDTPEALKNRIGGDQVEVVAAGPEHLAAVEKVVARVGRAAPRTEAETLRVSAPVADRVEALTEVARQLRDEAVDVVDLAVRRPTLDEVFLRLTGSPAENTTRSEGADGAGTTSQEVTAA
ncbi:daunorubicin resistance protein DrrA family ABC transporter ATP-binding protein [Streptomyces chumphonensis]|uniref:ATP-binding cassette domain-containing protein n=1 Tax=Streptomyces chumphonensis TaxID=1214925 RepID=A0A927IE52_9ACTN|nr:ATP-binding cassette domain-containing protein [Streptomyces chumphonensis]MBD3932986.1 ATP-binding cassette domain-containing protein [Streptomyces chumphonensis]